MAGRQMQEDLLRVRWRSNRLTDLPQHPASDEGWSAMDPGKDDRTIRAAFKMPPNPGPSEGICESLDEIDRLLEEEGES